MRLELARKIRKVDGRLVGMRWDGICELSFASLCVFGFADAGLICLPHLALVKDMHSQ